MKPQRLVFCEYLAERSSGTTFSSAGIVQPQEPERGVRFFSEATHFCIASFTGVNCGSRTSCTKEQVYPRVIVTAGSHLPGETVNNGCGSVAKCRVHTKDGTKFVYNE